MGDSGLVQDVHKGHRPRQAGAKVCVVKGGHQKSQGGRGGRVRPDTPVPLFLHTHHPHTNIGQEEGAEPEEEEGAVHGQA
jgi:hypothetical protein